MVVVDGFSPNTKKVEDQVKRLVKNKKADTCAIAYGSSIQRADVQQQVLVMGMHASYC